MNKDAKLLTRAADNIRVLAASMVEKAKSGHPGGAMGGADFVNVLYSSFLVTDPDDPSWIARDRCLPSAVNTLWRSFSNSASGAV